MPGEETLGEAIPGEVMPGEAMAGTMDGEETGTEMASLTIEMTGEVALELSLMTGTETELLTGETSILLMLDQLDTEVSLELTGTKMELLTIKMHGEDLLERTNNNFRRQLVQGLDEAYYANKNLSLSIYTSKQLQQIFLFPFQRSYS